ncbi:GntR family transcriptional regulator [Streptomyces cavernicola]|uniref:Winged helix-turn-helix domain-containing protein n=1 Tax=Streptomyces cavernicola TaxID=3043613 RepID=A0ABT6SGS7_9ACTN|nr:winged helix-turn-helix domain-containing protein [Streptomyces sp. B-S-A6]MDI3407405.1 winged helix-turn-helix domain-containing protein [Streptomyces sp. B-S-A6]
MVVTQESVAVNGRKPSHKDIADELRRRIRSGAVPAGSRMPTQAKLAEEFGVERGAIRQALAILAREGLLMNVSKGSPPQVAERAPLTEEPQASLVALGPRLVDAFEETPHITIDAVCLTSATLMVGLSDPLRLIYEGRIRPESITLRVLLPSSRINLAFPVPAGEPSEHAAADDEVVDEPVHRRWLAQRNAQGQVLRHNLRALRNSHGIDVKVEFKALPFTPATKLYLLNGTDALLAYYMVTKREEEIDSEKIHMYDALGTQSLLFSFDSSAGPRDEAFVTESQKWFDALWNTIARTLTLS